MVRPVEIRVCGGEDIDLLDRCMPSEGETSFHRQRFERQQDGGGTYLVAWRDKQPVGHLEIRWSGCSAPAVKCSVPACPELNALGVWPPGERGQGVGTALLLAAEEKARARKFRIVGLGVAEDNFRAGALYARLGYMTRGPRYHDNWSWTDEEGVVREESRWATFLIKHLLV